MSRNEKKMDKLKMNMQTLLVLWRTKDSCILRWPPQTTTRGEDNTGKTFKSLIINLVNDYKQLELMHNVLHLK